MRSNPTTVAATGDSTTEVAVEYGQVNVSTDHDDNAPEDSAWYTPTQARTLAAALLRAADEAEGLGDPFPRLREASEKYNEARWAEEALVPATIFVDVVERWFPEEGK